MPGATIYDVAERAGVSISTVSRVLNAPEHVKYETRTRVLEAINDLGFVPKVAAAERARKSSQRLGVLAPFFTYPSFVQRLRGISQQIVGSNYELVIYNIDGAERRDNYLTSLPLTRRLDGLIMMSLPLSEQLARNLARHELVTVLIETSGTMFSSVEIDDRLGGRMAADHLVGLGHRRIAFVGDSEIPSFVLQVSLLRLEGFVQGLAAHGITLAHPYISQAPHGLEQAIAQGHQLLSLPEPPTAIFASSDTQAMGVLKAARERGLRVPHDLAVIGFDDIDIADYIGLTTIRQHLEESGRVAVDLLLARLEGSPRPPQRIQLPVELVRRETT
ncbi:MAG TPA: LacI family DNA-binding transcriptional regulator [Roseiflexaceae bacterium]|nr:LacI family DNA-binding transcriptional regulator [Roseiflexaceae bacterium]